MPKNVLKLENFSGGLNNNTNKRDVKKEELVLLDGVDIETPGKVRLMGHVDDVSVSNNNDHIDLANPYTHYYGSGLMHLNLDRKIDSASNTENTEYLFINDPTIKKVMMFNNTEGSIINASNTSTINYGSTSAKVEYLVIDGDIRISPWVDLTGTSGTPFAVNNRVKKLKFLNTKKRLGVSDTGVANAPNIDYNKVFVADNAYIAPIKARDTVDANANRHYGSPDGYGYDVNAEMGKDWFAAEWESEATCNTTFVEANIDDANSWLVSVNAQTITQEFNNHSEWSGGSYGGIELAIWTGNTVDDNSSIYNWYSTTTPKPDSYEIFASNVYDTQESVPVHLGTVINHLISGQDEDKKVQMHYCMIGRVPNKPSQTGINFYWARRRDGEIGQKYLLFEVNFEKGYRKGGDDTWNIFYEKVASGGDFFYVSNQYAYSSSVNGISSLNKSLQEMPEDEPYVEKEDTAIGRLGTGYKTATIVNRRAYVGNVAYYKDKKDNTGYITVANDTVFKSPVNEFDYFPLDNKIDVEINDGDDIIKLASVGDKLLEFKRNTLYIINCSRDIEYLEGSYKHKGVEKEFHVIEGEGFVAWINRFGAYLYDGEAITNILYNEIGQKRLVNWGNDYYHNDNVLGYLPHKQSLFIGNKNGKVIMYDLKSNSWMYSSNRFNTDDISNMVTLNDGTLVWYAKNSNDLKLYKWDDSVASLTLSNNNVLLQTKDFTMDSPESKKKIHSVYINYKYPGSGDSTVEIQAIPDNVPGANNEPGVILRNRNFDNESTVKTVLPKTGGIYKTLHIKLRDTNEAEGEDKFKNINSLALAIVSNGSAIDGDFEINDIQIVYREKTLK